MGDPCGLAIAIGWTGGHPVEFFNARSIVESVRGVGAAAAQAVPFMHSDMNFLRSSPFMPFDFVLHAPILLS